MTNLNGTDGGRGAESLSLPFVVRFLIVALVLNSDGVVFGFTSVARKGTNTASRVLTAAPLPSPEESAKALSDYMAKAHSEKLRAIKEVEDKKNAEIEALRKEMDSMKSDKGALVTSVAPPQGSLEELQTKLVNYQQFMAKYIVEAQEQKMQAVKAAEAALTKKYEEKLTLMLPGDVAVNGDTSPAVTFLSKEQQLFAGRNAQVTAAAEAGKSRWGEMEVSKAAVATANGATASNVAVVAQPSEAQLSKEQVLYQARNAMVAEAGKAGKSRWGEMEIAKATEFLESPLFSMSGSAATSSSAPAIIVTPEIEAADHGMRADGGVSGPTLAERVNLGAQLMAGAL